MTVQLILTSDHLRTVLGDALADRGVRIEDRQAIVAEVLDLLIADALTREAENLGLYTSSENDGLGADEKMEP